MNITTEELARIRAIAEADKEGADGKAWDEAITPDTMIALCRELELARKHAVTMSEVAAAKQVKAQLERLDREVDWLATKLNEIVSPCRTLHPCEGSPSCNYPDGEPRCWRNKAAREAVEEGEEPCLKN